MTLHDDVRHFERSAIGELFTHDAAYIRNLVCRAFSGELTPEQLTLHQMLWYSIATTARYYAFARSDISCEVDLAWAELANMTYGHLSSLPGREHMMPAWMGLKVRLIACLGDSVPRALADPAEVLGWFTSILTMSYGEAARLLGGSPKDIELQKAAAIAQIREAVRLVSPLRHTEAFQSSPAFQEWRALFEDRVRR